MPTMGTAEWEGQTWDHTFSCQAKDAQSCLPGRPRTAPELGTPWKIRHTVLNEHPVDVLLVDDVEVSVWLPWIRKCDKSNRPKCFVWTGPSDLVTDEKDGPVGKLFRKQSAKLGYSLDYWVMASEHYGAAIAQDRLVVVCTLGGTGPRPCKPLPTDLPPRNMSNLLLPVGIPRKAYHTGEVDLYPDSRRWWPCDVRQRAGSEPIFERFGLMPDRPHSWIRSERGVRRLQHSEWAKGKGIPSEWITGNGGHSKPLREPLLRRCTSYHLLVAVIDEVETWIRGCEESCSPPLLSQPDTGNKDSTSLPPNPATDEPYDWNWEVPDLSPGSPWHTARTCSLKAAISSANLPEPERHFQEGLDALSVHRGNYSEAGPQRLQLLWWEFPVEHWEPIREGSSVNFLITPGGELQLNSEMTDDERDAASRFVDELIGLGTLQPATEELEANCPLFCVDKADTTEKRCITDCKRGGQNACTGQDPTFLIQSEDILSHLYAGGWTAIADISKYFHNYKTLPSERKYLGCIHPATGVHYVYCGLTMGGSNSPAIAGKMGNGSLRQLRGLSHLFHGERVVDNTWRASLCGEPTNPAWGHGRVEIGADGLPVNLVFSICDDFMVHGPTKRKCGEGFSAYMDHTVRLGFICQKRKTKPPAQIQKFGGLLYDTREVPKTRIPDAKLSRSLATIDYLERTNLRGGLSRLSVAVGTGLLQSLVDATPQRLGQTYLRDLYTELHELQDHYGKAMYYTTMVLSDRALDGLAWWRLFLQKNPGNPSRSGTAGTLSVSFGDGSGTGTGGTMETLAVHGPQLPDLEAWMGMWSAQVLHFTSNWKELRTLLRTLERIYDRADRHKWKGVTLFYFTDNQVTYYVVQNGSSSSEGLHSLVRAITNLEVLLGCRLEVIHVPGTMLIRQGADGLSRGVWMSNSRNPDSSLSIASEVLGAVPFCPSLGAWTLQLAGLAPGTAYRHVSTLGSWDFRHTFGRLTIWTPTPETARHALRTFLEMWVEGPSLTAGLFLIPRVMQRDWGYFSKHVHEVAVVYPSTLPACLGLSSLIPFVVLYVPHYARSLPVPDRMEPFAHTPQHYRRHQLQADHVRGLR